MNLFIYSYFPVRDRHMAGGAQLLMRDLLLGLAQLGVTITVVCPEGEQNDIMQSSNITTLPLLKADDDRGLDVSEIRQNLFTIAEYAQNSDVIWSVDRSFPMRARQPIVLTLATIAYQTEIAALMEVTWDVLVATSNYIHSVVNSLLGAECWDGDPRPIVLIPSAIDTAHFVQSDPTSLREALGLSTEARVLLFPHRPDPRKGFASALSVLEQLVEETPQYMLLIPTFPRSIQRVRDKERKYYEELFASVQRSRIRANVVFHDWLELSALPQYFSLGEWCLTLSSLPEGFGFTPVQALACGTPVISTLGGALRAQFPPGHGVIHVDFDRPDQVISAIRAGCLREAILLGQEFIKRHYSLDECVNSYLKCFESARKSSSQLKPLGKAPLVRLSPWCHLDDSGETLWHDLKMTRLRLTPRQYTLVSKMTHDHQVFHAAETDSTTITELLANGSLIWTTAQGP